MNKIIQINLGGFPFTIDEDAYERLSNYLKVIHRHFRQSPGYEDITSDIESRVAELFLERLEGRPIINLKDVEKVIVTMGTPAEFGADPMDETETASRKYKTGKRLFRDSEDKVIGGISSGIAAYFGFQNPLWIRLVFIGLTVMGGLGIALYIILWFALPQAESASDKLAMRGQPINISTIGKIVETELDHLSDAVSELEEELTAKKKSYSKANNLLSRGFSAVWKFCKKTIKIMVNIFKPFLIVIAVGLIIFFSITWIGALIGIFYASPFIEYLLPENIASSALPKVNLLFVVGVPLLTLVLLVSRLMFQTRVPAFWQAGLALLWIGNVGSLAFFGIHTARGFAMNGVVTDTFELPKSDMLQLEFGEDPYESGIYLFGPYLQMDGKALISKDVGLEIVQAKGPEARLVKTFSSRGSSLQEAETAARQIRDGATFENGTLKVQQYFLLPDDVKWRNQHSRYSLQLPVGQYFTYAGASRGWGHHPHWNGGHGHNHFGSKYQGRTFKMTEEGVACINCDNEAAEEYHFSNRDFNALEIDGKFELRLQQANEYSIDVITDPATAKSVDITQDESRLKINQLKSAGQPVQLVIRTPELEFLALRHLEKASIQGFNNSIFRLRADNSGKIFTNLDSDTVSLNLSDVAELRMRGEIKSLNGQLRNQSRIEAHDARIEKVDMDLKENSQAHFGNLKSLKKSADEESLIRTWHVERIIEE